MNEAQLYALAVALAWIAGVRAYLAVFAIGLAGLSGWISLPGELALCQSPWVLTVSGVLTVVEFSADKIPGVDSGWDLLQTLVRIPIGAFLAGAALGDAETGLSTAGLLAGSAAALSAHALKSATRAVINTSPEPVSNWMASASEDGLAMAALPFAFVNPWLALLLVVAGSLLLLFTVMWVIRRLLRVATR
ncbi:MAG: DUF4126 domain-containing protein [Pseudomarimonas sp.]